MDVVRRKLMLVTAPDKTSTEVMALGMHVRGACPEGKMEFKLLILWMIF